MFMKLQVLGAGVQVLRKQCRHLSVEYRCGCKPENQTAGAVS